MNFRVNVGNYFHLILVCQSLNLLITVWIFRLRWRVCNLNKTSSKKCQLGSIHFIWFDYPLFILSYDWMIWRGIKILLARCYLENLKPYLKVIFCKCKLYCVIQNVSFRYSFIGTITFGYWLFVNVGTGKRVKVICVKVGFMVKSEIKLLNQKMILLPHISLTADQSGIMTQCPKSGAKD